MKKALVVTAACLAAQPAMAQDTTESREGQAPIVVTSQLETQAEAAGRLGLTNRETPAIVDVLTQDQLQARGVRNAVEAINAAPGVTSGTLPGSMGSVSMRGFHRAVNYLYDGVRMANSDVGVRNWDAWAFERIEVIKGPASVTSGEGALAGAINFVPRRPQLGETTGEALASYGSFDSARLAADVNLPVGETVALRANASYARTSGWIDDTDSHTFAASGSLLFKPTEQFSLVLSADYFEDDYTTIYYGTPLVSAAVARDPSDAVSGSAGLVLDKAMRRVNFNLDDGVMGSDTLWLRARAQLELAPSLTLVSDTSWYASDRSWRDSDEYTFNAATGLIDRYTSLITHDHEYWNQRLHLAFDGTLAGMRSRLTLGAEFGKTDFFTVRRFGSAASADPFAPVRGQFPADTPANFGTRQDITAEVEALALFAEAALNLTPELLVVGGLRLDDVKLDRTILQVTSGAMSSYGQDYSPLSWRLGTVYSVTPRTQLFAQYTRAVTPVSGLLFLSAANARFDQTHGYSYEGGVKTSLTGSGVELTASVFKIRQDDILTRDPVNPAVVVQGGNLRSRGVEMALNIPATEELSVGLSGTLLDASYGELIEAGGADRSGNRPPNVPEQVFDMVVTYAPRALPIRLTAQAQHNGSFFTANANTVKVKAATTFDAAIAWTGSFGTLTLRGRNLTDAFYADWSGYASGLVFIGAPRSAELSWTGKF
jgi:iron complex outermembrane receptor protein